MSHNSKVPMGNLIVDARALADIVIDLEPGERQGMRTEQKGYAEVITEIISNQPTYGEQAGITKTDIERIIELDRRIALIDQYLPAAEKLHELLTETRAASDDERQRLVSAFAHSVETRAKASRGSVLLAKYQKTRSYRSASANKAAKTRRKNAALIAESEAAEQQEEA